MAHTGWPELSSIFNDLLAQNRKQFDALYRGGRPHTGEPAAAARSAVAEPRGAVPPSPTPSILLDPQSPAIRRLNERFGNDWRYEIAEQRRDGEEAIVLCKLIFGKERQVLLWPRGRHEFRPAVQAGYRRRRTGRTRRFPPRRRSGAVELPRSVLTSRRPAIDALNAPA